LNNGCSLKIKKEVNECKKNNFWTKNRFNKFYINWKNFYYYIVFTKKIYLDIIVKNGYIVVFLLNLDGIYDE